MKGILVPWKGCKASGRKQQLSPTFPLFHRNEHFTWRPASQDVPGTYGARLQFGGCRMRGSQCFSHQLTVCLFGNPPGKIDAAFDGTWLTCEHIIEMYICWSCWTYHRYVLPHISVRCIVAVYSGLLIDHVVLSNFCLVGSIGLKPHDEGYADWLTTHTPVGQKDDCKARLKKAEAAFHRVPMSSGEAQAAIHRHSVRWGQQYVSRSGTRRCVRIAKTPEDCMNRVCSSRPRYIRT